MEMNNMFSVFQTILTIIVSAATSFVIFRLTLKRDSAYECERLYMEIAKILLAEPKLWNLYKVGSAEEQARWDALSDDQKREYIFCELNYFHFAFVYRELKAGRVDEKYWKPYELWLKKLVGDFPTFKKVHLDSKDHFYPLFQKMIEDNIQKAQ